MSRHRMAGGIPVRGRRAVLRAAAAVSMAAMLAACSPSGRPQFRNTDVTGADFSPDVRLTGHDGKPHALADWRGKAVVVFFGYTQCPDVCPTTMAEMADTMRRLGARADEVQVLFVTVDPERDTPQILAQYVPAFDARFMGLTGTPEQTTQAVKSFKAFYQKVPGKTPGSYTVDHSSGSYVFDRQGRLRLFVRHGQGPEALAHDLGLLLDERRG